MSSTRTHAFHYYLYLNRHAAGAMPYHAGTRSSWERLLSLVMQNDKSPVSCAVWRGYARDPELPALFSSGQDPKGPIPSGPLTHQSMSLSSQNSHSGMRHIFHGGM
jgi:hypothetical protein